MFFATSQTVYYCIFTPFYERQKWNELNPQLTKSAKSCCILNKDVRTCVYDREGGKRNERILRDKCQCFKKKFEKDVISGSGK